jgi:hypothetical protein
MRLISILANAFLAFPCPSLQLYGSLFPRASMQFSFKWVCCFSLFVSIHCTPRFTLAVLQGGGGFVIQRPKEFIAYCLERFESINMVDTFTRQVNLYQFAYVPSSSVSRHKLWESNTLGAIGACRMTVMCFACSCCTSDSFQTNNLVLHCHLFPVYSDPRGIFTPVATALELSNIRPARLKRKARGHHPAECLRRGIHVYCRSCLAGIGEEGSGSDDDPSSSGRGGSRAEKIHHGTRGRQLYARDSGTKPSSAVDTGISSSSPGMPESDLPSSTFDERQPPTHVVSVIAGGLQDFSFAGGASFCSDFDYSNVESRATHSAQAGSKRFASHDDAADVPAQVADRVSSLKRSRIDTLSAAASVTFSLSSIPEPAVFLTTTDSFGAFLSAFHVATRLRGQICVPIPCWVQTRSGIPMHRLPIWLRRV